jgi:predicted RNase H-like HicB family nuclease
MNSAPSQEPLLHLLSVREDAGWVMHCLDFDIAAQGVTEAEARRNLLHAIELVYEQALEDGTTHRLFRSAPQDLWDQYVRSPAHRSGRFTLDIRRPSPEVSTPKSAKTEERVSSATSAA